MLHFKASVGRKHLRPSIASNAVLLPKVRLFQTSQPQVCICDRRPRLTAKRFQNGRPACSPESPDRLHETFASQRTAVGETFRAVPACVLHWWRQRTWYQSVAWIEVKAPGGAGPGSQETRSHDLPVLAVQLPVGVPQRPSRHLLGQEILRNHAKEVSVQERICNISRAWPDVSHLIKAGVANPGPESEKPASLPPFTCQWRRSTCGSSQTVAGESLSGLGFSPCGCCR
ncbi:uncharacterized protein [Syngnathus scovelli]|uniref:uncharacterized protein n=1 Tax=Syngnathus scovelli TaxID=161590 RepID=UPI0035C94E7D